MASITAFWSQIVYALSNIRVFDIIDIVAMAYIIYQAMKFLRDSRAGQLVKGLLVLLVIFLVSDWFDLVTLKWLLTMVGESLLVLAVIIFQPELRRALESVGRSNLRKIGKNQLVDSEKERIETLVANVCKAVANMHDSKTGALIVFERETPLGEVINTGTMVDALASTELVQNLFYPKSPLHDGGMIIRGDRIVSAGCILPLTSNADLSSQLGTRHRAAIGMSELSDAVVVVVSEETGTISIANNGVMQRDYNPISLREELNKLLIKENEKDGGFYKEWLSKKFKKSDKH